MKLHLPSRQNLNLGNATANTTGMAGRDEIEDMLLIAHNNGRLSDIQLLCLVNELKRNDFAQSNFPYELYPPFNWDNYDENTCQNEMRFEKADILRLKRCLQIPDEVKFYKGSYYQGLEALCILLKRLAYPVRYCDMVPRFGRSVPDLRKIYHLMLNHIYDNFSYLLQQWDTPFLSQELLQSSLKKLFWVRRWHGSSNMLARKVSKVVYNGQV